MLVEIKTMIYIIYSNNWSLNYKNLLVTNKIDLMNNLKIYSIKIEHKLKSDKFSF